MLFDLVDQEKTLYALDGKWRRLIGGTSRFKVTVTNRRIMVEFLSWKATNGHYVPLEMIDSVRVESRRLPFPTKLFIGGLIALIVPGLLILLSWLIRRDEVIQFGSGDEPLELYGFSPTSPGTVQLFRVVETARQDLLSSDPAPDALPDSPPKVTLSP